MSIPLHQNIGWQLRNTHRRYPLEDGGHPVPVGVLSDLHVWFTGASDDRVILSSLGLTSKLISLTLGVAGPSFRPLAGITLPKPIEPGRNYPLVAFESGAAGWVSFGAEANTITTNLVFTDLEEAAVLPSLARALPTHGVTSVKRVNRATKLNGEVLLQSSQPGILKIAAETINLPNRDVPGFVFSLNEEEAGPDIYKRYLGPCDHTPDSDTCNRPAIHSLNGAVPDCDGVVTLIFSPAIGPDNTNLLVVNIVNEHTLALDFLLGLSYICRSVNPKITPNLSRCDDPCDYDLSTGPFVDYPPMYL